MNMQHHIREFTPEDYVTYCTLRLTCYPEYPTSAQEIRFRDEHRDPKCKHGRWLAELGDRVVAAGAYDQWPDLYHPRKFWLDIAVLPEHHNQGIGGALYEHLMDALRAHDPIAVRLSARENRPASIRFITKRDFCEEMRDWESKLALQSLDISPYTHIEAELNAQGITLHNLQELRETDPDWLRKLHAIESETDRDAPAPDPVTEMDFDYYVKYILESPDFRPDLWYLAVHENAYIGTSALWARQSSSELFTGLTGVKREYRRMGIATALKIKTLAHAKSLGVTCVRTWNSTRNRPMLSINERLGFIKEPAWITFVKELKEEQA